MSEIEKEFEAWWATEPFGYDHPDTKEGVLRLLRKQEAKLEIATNGLEWISEMSDVFDASHFAGYTLKKIRNVIDMRGL